MYSEWGAFWIFSSAKCIHPHLIIIIMSSRVSRCNVSRSRATAVVTSQLYHLALFRSFSTFLLQVVFGLPLALLPSGLGCSKLG